MTDSKPKVPKKGAVKRLREFYEKNRGRASTELVDILKTPKDKPDQDKKSAKPRDNEAEL